MTTKRNRKRAAILYAAAFLWRDDGELAAEFSDELKELAHSLLRRARWSKDDLPSVDDIEDALRGKG
jgi:hypothetical protein